MKTKFNGILTLLLALLVQISFAQQKTISGTVSDDSGPLPGVNVIIKGTSNGTQTDFDGKYSIKANAGQVLVFSFVGMETIEKTVGTSSAINASMKGSNLLEEVVVTAYGTQNKESLTGSIAEIKSEEFTKVASGNAVTGLTGKVAGVQIFSNSGQPGSAPNVRFRGIGSLNGSSEPLYVVDGVPYSESITNINPSDIKSMSFVKDASAAALYGNRGANGVVIITTKKGSSGKPVISLDLKTSITDRAIKDYDVITDMGQYFEAYHKMLKNNNIVVAGATEEDAGVFASNELISGDKGLVYNPYGGNSTDLVDPVTGKFRGGNPLWSEDWRDFIFNNYSGVQTAYLSVSGGTENTKYYTSIGHENNTGYNINTGFKRNTISGNIESNITDNLKATIGLSYTNREQKGTLTNNITGNFAWVRNIAPIYPVYAKDHKTGETVTDKNGNPEWDWADVKSPNAPGGRPYSGFSNPHALQSLNVNKGIRDNFGAKASVAYNITDDLKFTYTMAYDLGTYTLVDYTNKKVGSASSEDISGRLRERYGRRTTITNQQLINYTKTLADVHNFDILLGHESARRNSKNIDVNLRKQFLSSDLSPDLFAQVDGDEGILGDSYEYNLEGFFARFMYNFDNKYFINANYRKDGSSVFHPDNRWGDFYGFGAAWIVSKENFLSSVDWLNEFKLKTSYGQLGNDIVYYDNSVNRNYTPYLDQWYVKKNGTYFSPDKTILGNKDLTWETTTNFNAGFELNLFDNRLTIESEYFIRKITDLIHNRDLPNSTGLPSIPENVMDMENKGVELLIAYDILKKEDLNWSVSLNATSYKNKITKLAPGKEHIVSGRYRWKVGVSAYDYYMRDYLGVNPENGNAIWKTDKEFEADGTTLTEGTTEDYGVATQYDTGTTALPDVYGGLSTAFNFKNFDFSVDLSYQFGGMAYDAVYDDTFDGEIGKNLHKDFFNTWTWDNKTAKLPRVDTDTNNWNQFSDFNLIKSDYISLNNITLGYTLPLNVIDKLGIETLRIYLNGNNLALWTPTDYDGFDPRQRVAGDNNAVRYAALKTYTLGVNIKF